MQIFVGGIAFVVAIIANSVAVAASVTSTVSKEGKIIVSITGEISDGDADALRLIIKSANEGARIVSGIRLNSRGGSILEGSRLAEIIRYGKIATVVANASTCASACFIVFAAGNPKYASYSAFVGVHGASDQDGRETVATGAATISMARMVRDLGVPAPIIGRMVVTPPDRVVWLTPDDLRSMGAVMTGKPAQLPSASAPPLGQPMQLDLSARVATPTNKPAPVWSDIVGGAIALSQQQNRGNAAVRRVCQPEIKSCVNAIMFKLDGVEMMVRTTEDVKGVMIRRDWCAFNEFGDIRRCSNWDTGELTQEMKNRQGEWVMVGGE